MPDETHGVSDMEEDLFRQRCYVVTVLLLP